MHKITEVGTLPGTIIYNGRFISEPPLIELITYTKKPGEMKEKELVDIAEFDPSELSDNKKAWLNITGLHDTQWLSMIGEHLGIHPLIMEDVANVNQRPNADSMGDYVFVTLKMLNYDEKSDTFQKEHLSILFNQYLVITFHEAAGDDFDHVRNRIRNGTRIIERGGDYLAYALIDAVTDNYFLGIERLGEWIEDLDKDLITQPTLNFYRDVRDLKKDMMDLRRNIWPVRDVVNHLLRQDFDMIAEETRFYFRDVYDHISQIIDTLEVNRDNLESVMDMHINNLSFRSNETMKTLTVITAIFIPLTFISSVYGMNFDIMPELHFRFGYFVTMGAMVLIAVTLIIYFRRKKWL